MLYNKKNKKDEQEENKFKNGDIERFTLLLVIFYSIFLIGLKVEEELQEYKEDYLLKASHYSDILQKEKNWLASTQLSNGAYTSTPIEAGNNMGYVNPYFASNTALALMKGDTEKKYQKGIQLYFDWHFSKLNDSSEDINNLDATIYDYNVIVHQDNSIEEISKNNYDSVDSYAALFLTAIYNYYDTYDDTDYVMKNNLDLYRVTTAMMAEYDEGLTFTKPDYKIKYLMDNCEVYQAINNMILLIDKVILPNSVKGTTLYDDWKVMRKKLKKALNETNVEIEYMWNKTHYETAIDEKGNVAYIFDYKEFYPSAVAQLYPVIFDVVDAKNSKSKLVYEYFCKEYIWEEFMHITDGKDNFYWSIISYAAVMMGDFERADKYLETYQVVIGEDRKYPLYSLESAWVIQTCDYLASYYQSKANLIFW